MEKLKEILEKIEKMDGEFFKKAIARQDILTKPQGSFGRLETLSAQVAAIQRREKPSVEKKAVFTFAGDHGVVYDEGINSAPKEVTAQMAVNFTHGGAGVNVLARHAGAEVVVVDVGIICDYDAPQVINKKIARGTASMTKERAMSREMAIESLIAGIEVVEERIHSTGLDLMGVGEMGIGNTVPSSAIFSVLTGKAPEEVTGPGAGIEPEILKKKIEVVQRAVELHKPDKNDALEVLSCVGGLEIGAMAGAILAGSAYRIPVVIDGFISTAAALIALTLAPDCRDSLIFSHHSAETGHNHALNFAYEKPLLDLDMRLGEGTGSALAMTLVEASVKILNEMTTFEEAAVFMVERK